MTDPTLLRRAIESVGIEKPSDYTLVLEEVERLMDEQADANLIEAAGLAEPTECIGAWRLGDGSIAIGGYHHGPAGEPYMVIPPDERFSALIRAATDLVQEMEEMGYGKTSDRALPGSYDNLLAALNEVKK